MCRCTPHNVLLWRLLWLYGITQSQGIVGKGKKSYCSCHHGWHADKMVKKDFISTDKQVRLGEQETRDRHINSGLQYRKDIMLCRWQMTYSESHTDTLGNVSLLKKNNKTKVLRAGTLIFTCFNSTVPQLTLHVCMEKGSCVCQYALVRMYYM